MSRIWVLVVVSCLAAISAADLRAQGTTLMSTAERLVADGPVHLSRDLSCSVHDAAGRARDAFTASDAGALVAVARERAIYIFVHGFHPNRFGGRPAPEDVAETWADYVAAIGRTRQPFVACLMRFDTRQGFGDHQPELGNFLHALRWLTDGPELYDPARRIYLVGYSAGGNYIKHGLELFDRNLAASGLPRTGRAPTRMRVLTLATPHIGTNASWNARAVAAWWEFIVHHRQEEARTYDQLSEQRWQQRLTAEWRFIAESPGARQLGLGHPDILQLNADLRANTPPNVEVLALVGDRDQLAPPAGAQLRAPGIVEHVVAGMGHTSWLRLTRDTTVAVHVEHFLGLRPTTRRVAEFAEMHQELYGSAPPTASIVAVRPSPRDPASVRFALRVAPRATLSLAAERYLRSRAVGSPDERELVALSDAIAARVTAARIAPEFARFLVAPNDRGEDELRLWQIPALANGDASMVPGTVRAAAEHLQLEIDRLFGPALPLNSPWAPPGMVRQSAAQPEIVRPDSLRVAFRGVGGLEEERLVPIHEAIGSLWDDLRFADEATYARTSPATFSGNIGPLTSAGVMVIGATYQTDNGLKSTTYYYWHRELPAALTPAFLATLEPRHPLFRIGDPREHAPDRQPSDLPTSSLLRHAGAAAPPRPRDLQHDGVRFKTTITQLFRGGLACRGTDREYGIHPDYVRVYRDGTFSWAIHFRALPRTANALRMTDTPSVNVRNLRLDGAQIDAVGQCTRVRVPTRGEGQVRTLRTRSLADMRFDDGSVLELYLPDRRTAEHVLAALAAFAVPVPDSR